MYRSGRSRHHNVSPLTGRLSPYGRFGPYGRLGQPPRFGHRLAAAVISFVLVLMVGALLFWRAPQRAEDPGQSGSPADDQIVAIGTLA